jgi:predicted HTH transcriptional regulator
MKKLRIFVSSVQKELEVERVALAGWVSSDPQLADACDVVLFEKEPLSGKRISIGNCQPCSRNPVLGQYLNHLQLMDQRGSGIGRMKSAMLNHGLDEPQYDLVDGYFRVTLKGPGDDLARLRMPASVSPGISPAKESKLTDRQKTILEQAVAEGHVTTGWVLSTLKVSKITAVRDLNGLCDLGLLVLVGKGRGVRYVPGPAE